jgi:hypothetical protein
MKKSNKLRNRKLKKGGKSIIEKRLGLDANTTGPFIADDIDMNIRLNNKDGLLTEYETRKINAEKRYNEIEKKYNENHKQKLEEDTLYFKVKKQRDLQWDRFYNNILKTGRIIGSFFSTIGSAIWKILQYLGNAGGYTFAKFIDFISSLAKTPLLNTIAKVLILLGIILIIIFGSLGFFSSNSSNPTGMSSTSIDSLKNQSLDMANTNNFFIKTPQPPTIFGIMGLTFQNLVPDKYRVQFTAFKNNVNKAFGNDLTEQSIYNIKRDEIKTGRTDDIIHINLDNNNEKIYTMVKPKDIEININYDNGSKKTDFYKLPEKIQQIYKENYNKLQINGTTTEKGLFYFPAETINFKNSNKKIYYDLNKYNIINPFYNDSNSSNFILTEYSLKNSSNIFNNSGTTIMMEYKANMLKYPPLSD